MSVVRDPHPQLLSVRATGFGVSNLPHPFPLARRERGNSVVQAQVWRLHR
jgi:hypothetical protein